MAHYAFLYNNIVTEVIVGIDETELIEGLPPEEWYGNFRKQPCVRTSYNAANNGFRGKFAGIGDFYDATTDKFYPADWTLVDGVWQAPPVEEIEI
jgi:hypothetical protein